MSKEYNPKFIAFYICLCYNPYISINKELIVRE